MMLHLFMGNDSWFRAKRYGLGAGLPIRWQGWALTASYIAALAGIGLLSKAPDAVSRGLAFALFLIVTAMFLAIVRGRTEGGWKWRWGGDA
jgi:ABC-type multidrug transport system permease subunit